MGDLLSRLCLMALLALLCSCSSDQNTSSTENGGLTDLTAATTPAESSRPAATGTPTVSLPKSFPGDVVIFPAMSLLSISDTVMGYMLSAETLKDRDQVADFYLQHMPEHGWSTQPQAKPTRAMKSLRFMKGRRSTTVNLTTEKKLTTVQIVALTVE